MKINWHRNQEVLHSQIDDEAILMSIESSRYYGLDTVASHIWELLAEPHTLEELCRKLREEYEVDQQTCTEETLAFLRQLEERKLVHQSEAE